MEEAVPAVNWWRTPAPDDVDANNMLTGKNYASGIIPTCYSPEGVGYFLIGLQPSAWYKKVGNRQGKIGWSYFTGWQDVGDLNKEFTAAREASEETINAIGNFNFLFETLNDKSSCCELASGTFLICFGELNDEQRRAIVETHKRGRKYSLSVSKREMQRLKWITAADMKEAVTTGTCKAMQSRHSERLERKFRSYVRKCFADVSWEEGPLSALSNGENPFPLQKNRWEEWINRRWVPENDLPVKPKTNFF